MINTEIRKKAKELMQGKYAQAFLMALIIVGISLAVEAVISFLGIATGMIQLKTRESSLVFTFLMNLTNLLVIILQLGYIRSFLELAKTGELPMEYIFSYFSKSGLKLLVLNIVRGILIGLGTILLIVPGIYLNFSYVMADYIMMENPEIGVIDCLRESRQRMIGQKWNYFLLTLAYIGPFIVAFIVTTMFLVIVVSMESEKLTMMGVIVVILTLIILGIYYGVYVGPRVNAATAIFYKANINPDTYDEVTQSHEMYPINDTNGEI